MKHCARHSSCDAIPACNRPNCCQHVAVLYRDVVYRGDH